MRRNTRLRLIDMEGGANVGMLFYNPANLLERYNAPDTLKCQHTFKLTAGHCLYSDMGRMFCSIVSDTLRLARYRVRQYHQGHRRAQVGCGTTSRTATIGTTTATIAFWWKSRSTG